MSVGTVYLCTCVLLTYVCRYCIPVYLCSIDVCLQVLLTGIAGLHVVCPHHTPGPGLGAAQLTQVKVTGVTPSVTAIYINENFPKKKPNPLESKHTSVWDSRILKSISFCYTCEWGLYVYKRYNTRKKKP